MSAAEKGWLRTHGGRFLDRILGWVGPNWNDFTASRQPLIWLMALVCGLAAGVVAIAFREAIFLIQYLWVGIRTESLVPWIYAKSGWLIFLGPPCAGLLVGLIIERISVRRPFGVADVIEVRASARPRLSKADGAWSALATVISLGGGASAGREGPVVHLGATLATALVSKLQLPLWSRRTILAAGAASAISASFNAPIAGVLFAHEVILNHYSRRAFVPIVIASAAGSILSRLWSGDAPAFNVPPLSVATYWEFPAFALLGIVCALVAISFQFSLFAADYIARGIPMPLWLRPVLGGLVVGTIGVAYPEILGVGYGTTDQALHGEIPLLTILTLLVLKIVATSVTLASRFGGGVFSPALYLGAMAGAAFGQIAASIVSVDSSATGLYAALGMGAVAGAVLGAPVSTALIVFELTGGYALSIALLLTVAVAHGVNHAFHGRSWFQWQLEGRGLNLRAGPHRDLAMRTKVMDIMTMPEEDAEPETLTEEQQETALRPNDTLEAALRRFDNSGRSRLPVVDPQNSETVIAHLTQIKALSHYNRALISVSEEEHR
ncbi:chloride channel protein [Notoacmeibacter ruber]|uniref:Chloride channel protein n=1 Tax=Notoacmeibacter ruber TaxID=2670375 RepID=A0A3L7JBP3_9HYPH|nr:chloride channel protein [Notoacmeibacter ruber]RLQ88157.1 chloride channel protein [Notoacmeibacter ruber]